MLNPDKPVDGSEKRPDSFHRKEFAERIAKSLLLSPESDCLVASLEGGWGTGKTSVIEMIKRCYLSLPPEQQPIVISFNPWMFSGLGSLVKEFLVQFGSSLKINRSSEQLVAAGNELVKYSGIFDIIKFVPGAEPWASVLKGVLDKLGVSAKDIGQLHTPNLEDQRDKVVEALRKTEKSFVVFIDDIDRLAPDEVFTILRLVKSVSDFPRVSYLLAYEHKHVESALSQAMVPSPSNYIEKIVQLRLSLPRISQDDAFAYFNDSLRDFGESEIETAFEGEKERWQDYALHYILPLLRTPRDYIRLANRLRVNYPIVRGELSFSDYCCLETLAVVEPEVYEFIKNNPMAYIGKDPLDIFGLVTETIQKTEHLREEALGKIKAAPRKRIIAGMLQALFPRIRDNANQGDIPQRTSGRIANPDNFEYAFHFSRPYHLVDLHTLREIWFEPGKRSGAFAELAGKSRGKRVLQVIDELIFSTQAHYGAQDWGMPTEPLQFLQEYVVFTQNPALPEKLGAMFEPEYGTYFSRVYYWLSKRVDDSEKQQFAESIVNDLKLLPVGCEVVRDNLREHGHFKDKAEDPNPTFAKEVADRINSCWVLTCLKAIDEGTIWNTRHLSQLLLTMLHLDQANAITQSLDNNSVTNKVYVTALRALLGHGSINGRPYYGVDTSWTFQRLNLEKFQKYADSILVEEGMDSNEIAAIKLAFSNPDKSYYIDDASLTRD